MGGGIAVYSGLLTVTDSTVSGNSAFYGGGMYNGQDSTVTLTNSTVSGNLAYADGGLDNRGTVTLTNTTVSGNTASDNGGGGMSNGQESTVTLTNSTISGNVANGGPPSAVAPAAWKTSGP